MRHPGNRCQHRAADVSAFRPVGLDAGVTRLSPNHHATCDALPKRADDDFAARVLDLRAHEVRPPLQHVAPLAGVLCPGVDASHFLLFMRQALFHPIGIEARLIQAG